MTVIDIENGQWNESLTQNPTQNSDVVELEMILQNTSLAHEYARIELENTQDFLQQEQIIAKMEDLKQAYFMARHYLKQENPYRLEDFEAELISQKLRLFSNYSA